MAGLTTATWLLNVGAAFFATISGIGIPLVAKAGLVAAAVAIAGGVAFAGLGGFGGGANAEAREDEYAQRDMDNTDRVVSAVNAQGIRQEAIYERSRQELDPILRQLDCLTSRVDSLAEGATGGVSESTENPIEQRHIEPFVPFNFTPEEYAEAVAGVNKIERVVPTSNVGEQLQYYAGDRVIPFTPRKDDSAVMEALRNNLGNPEWGRSGGFRGLGGGDVERIRENMQETTNRYESNIENHFYNNPVPADTIIQETERELARMESRR